jgi:hypothetical protein
MVFSGPEGVQGCSRWSRNATWRQIQLYQQARQAEHILEAYEHRCIPEKEAERGAEATTV